MRSDQGFMPPEDGASGTPVDVGGGAAPGDMSGSAAEAPQGTPPPSTRVAPPTPGLVPPPSAQRRKKSQAWMVAVIVLSVVGACAVIGLGWIVVGTFGEFSVYEKAEKSYLAGLEDLEEDKADLARDGDAYIVANREKISAARKAVTAALATVDSLDDSEDRSDYVSTLEDVDKSLRVLEALATSEKGAAGIALELEQAGSPSRDAAEASDKAFKAYRSKDYSAMSAAAQTAASQATKAATALGTLDRTHPGLGIADLRDEAAAVGDIAGGVSVLAQAYQRGEKTAIESAATKLGVLESKYQDAANRAVRSVAYAVWEDPGAAVSDVLRQLDKAKAEHEKVYQRIDTGE